MKKLFIIAAFFSLTTWNAQTGNTGINTTSPKATLDVNLPSNYTNGQLAGVTIPQLTGDQIEAMSTANPKVGTLIYATSASTAATKDVTAVGYWYWKNATDKWEPLIVGSSASGNTNGSGWDLNGNTIGTNPNYIGTKDNTTLVFKTNADNDTNKKMIIDALGNVAINFPQPYTAIVNSIPFKSRFTVNGTTTTLGEDINIGHNVHHYGSVGAPVLSGYKARGTYANPTYPLTGDRLLFITGRDALAGFTDETATGGGAIEMSAAENFSYTNRGTDLHFLTTVNGGKNATTRMTVLNNGNVGIGTTNPASLLDISTTGSTLAGSARSSVFSTNAGTLGTTTGSELNLGSFGGSSVINNNSLTASLYRVSPGNTWPTSALLLNYSIDNTPRAGGYISLYNSNIGVNVVNPASTVDVNGTARVQNLPVKGALFIYNSASATYTPTQTVVADANGVLGTVATLPTQWSALWYGFSAAISANALSGGATVLKGTGGSITNGSITVPTTGLYKISTSMYSQNYADASIVAATSNWTYNINGVYKGFAIDYNITYSDNLMTNSYTVYVSLNAGDVLTFQRQINTLPTASVENGSIEVTFVQ